MVVSVRSLNDCLKSFFSLGGILYDSCLPISVSEAIKSNNHVAIPGFVSCFVITRDMILEIKKEMLFRQLQVKMGLKDEIFWGILVQLPVEVHGGMIFFYSKLLAPSIARLFNSFKSYNIMFSYWNYSPLRVLVVYSTKEKII